MKHSAQTKPLSYLETHAEDVLREVCETREPMLFGQNGEAKMVVLDLQSFEQQNEPIAMLQLLAMGSGEREAGQFRSAEDLFAELDRDTAE
ncbi:MAG: type II toxin-antitoxin system Phd/YefM family antitoxin [Gammaproteobacteria bacterium]